MKQQVQHLVRLVDDLLDVSRIMRGKIQFRKERVQLADVVARGVETARPLIDAQKHELAVSLPEEPVWLEVDPVRIAQVIANLLNNAAKYNDKPGHIVLTAEPPRARRPSCGCWTTASASTRSCCRGSSTCSPRPTAAWPARRAGWASA